MKRIAMLFFSFLCVCSLHAALDANAIAQPSAVIFNWNEVDGAEYYDIYNEDTFIVRLPYDTLSYRKDNLLSNTSYNFSIAARDSENNTLDASFLTIHTDCWDGIYEWVNRTDKDNRGRMKNLRVRVETAYDPEFGQYHKLYMPMDDGSETKIFPLYDFSDPRAGEWVDYKDKGEAGTSYRINADKLNTSVFNPSKWRLDKLTIGNDYGSAYVQSRALGITADTISSYHFFIEDGMKKMEYRTEGKGIAASILFKNPNPGEGGSFILVNTAS
ncbi:MAG: hypothetical protein IAA97_05440 [Spirochaetes bacterium]|uniref:Fibronectin type-III domain-containing protein n=1 Tax=Candidatus Ornithospirochaeta stercoripullorum TaxID=2840899 RepID=A0A9D9H5Z1_9SPIO|nr:hypothetical protein [Candidatus Ornithospirochaeta stercoripullorum]